MIQEKNKSSSVSLKNLLLIDSAFYELEKDSATDKNQDHFGVLHTDDERSIGISLCYDKHCLSSTGSPSMAELCASDKYAESWRIDELETSDTESQAHSSEWDSSSSALELFSSSSLSDKAITFPRHENENVCLSSDDNQCVDMLVASSLKTSVGNKSHLLQLQHQPLVFFIIGLFVGLSLGFFTCKYVADAV